MGRVARYKKVKSIDPFAKNGSWKSDVGDCSTLHRVKRKSKTAIKMKEQKMSKLQRRSRGKGTGDDVRRGGGSNGWGDDDGYDLPPEGGDEFDMNDLMGSVKRQGHGQNLLLLENDNANAGAAKLPSTSPSSLPSRFVGVSSSTGNMPKTSAATNGKANARKNDATTAAITAKTPTREIIASCSNPTTAAKKRRGDVDASTGTSSKQEKRKAFFEKKKMKKRKRGRSDDDEDDDDNDDNYRDNRNPDAVLASKKHLVKQQNYSDTMVARTAAFDVQAERPPTFTMLPRGASKLAKKKRDVGEYTISTGKEGDDDQQRIRKEKMDMEAMRERVMKQYAILRETRRNHG
jgi:hypothetical protein